MNTRQPGNKMEKETLSEKKFFMELTKELAQKLIGIEGECRGMTLKADWEFVLQEHGKEGLKKLETKMAELGFPLKYKEIRTMDFYPIGLDAISMLAIRELFDYSDEELEKMGASVVKFSLILKIFLKYFASLKLISEQISEMWKNYYTVGDLEVSEFSEEKRYVILRLRNFLIHPIYCIVLKGYFLKIAEMVVGAPVTCRENKCAFKEDEYHEYLLKWQ